jgi:hypothetical protein
MSDDLLKVVLDYNSAEPSERENIFTGRFMQIHSGEKVLTPDYIPNNNFIS